VTFIATVSYGVASLYGFSSVNRLRRADRMADLPLGSSPPTAIEVPIAFDGRTRQASGLDLAIVAINLPHRTDRWQALTARLGAQGLDAVHRVTAVNGRALAHGKIEPLLRQPADMSEAPASHLALTPPAVGCFLSHIGIWRWVIDSGLPRVLVLEDDAAPTADHTPERMRAFVEDQCAQHDQVFLGAIVMDGLAGAQVHNALRRLFYFNGTFAYVVTPAACRRLLDGLLPMWAHVDHQMSRFFIERRASHPAFLAAPALFEPDWTQRSDCYVPIIDETPADRALARDFADARALLTGEGHGLLPPFA
jgi:GR25 family glycosyltransferase involved in LPS biosynthesis